MPPVKPQSCSVSNDSTDGGAGAAPRRPLIERRALIERGELAQILVNVREIAAEGTDRRATRPRVVLANGCFDLLHVGHLRYLSAARAHGTILIVALNTDASIRANKGPGRPLMPLAERAELVAALRSVDYVTSFSEPTLVETLRILRPDVHAKGTDYTIDNVPEGDVDRELGIDIAICGDAKDHSTSALIQSLGVHSPGVHSPGAGPEDSAGQDKNG